MKCISPPIIYIVPINSSSMHLKKYIEFLWITCWNIRLKNIVLINNLVYWMVMFGARYWKVMLSLVSFMLMFTFLSICSVLLLNSRQVKYEELMNWVHLYFVQCAYSLAPNYHPCNKTNWNITSFCHWGLVFSIPHKWEKLLNEQGFEQCFCIDDIGADGTSWKSSSEQLPSSEVSFLPYVSFALGFNQMVMVGDQGFYQWWWQVFRKQIMNIWKYMRWQGLVSEIYVVFKCDLVITPKLWSGDMIADQQKNHELLEIYYLKGLVQLLQRT